MIRRLIFASLLAAIPATVSAQTAQDFEAAEAAVSAFVANLLAENYEEIAAVIPPRVIELAANQAQIGHDQFHRGLANVLEQSMADITLEHATMDIGDAISGISPSGRPYFVVPTESIFVTPENTRVHAVSHSLVLEDEGGWYVLRIANRGHREMLVELYPDLNQVNIPSQTYEQIP